MSANKISNNIDRLINSLYDSSILTSNINDDPVKSWTWEVDQKGNYTSCSDEVFDCLGIKANEFINKSIFTFHLTKESSEELKKFLVESKTGGNLDLRFEHQNGKSVIVNVYISPKTNRNYEPVGWAGMNEVLEEEKTPIAPVAKAEQPLQTAPVVSQVSPLVVETDANPKPQGKPDEPFNLSDYFMVLLRRRWVIGMTFFFTMLVVVLILLQMPNQYTAKTIVRVTNPRSGSADYVDYNTSLGQRLVNTYVELANGDLIKQDIMKYVNRLPTIKAEPITDSELFAITVEDPDPGLAQYTANKVAELVITNGISQVGSETPVDAYIAESATLPTIPSSPSPWLIIALAAFVGLLGGAGLAFIFENMDTRVYSDKQIESLTDLPVVGNIPNDIEAGKKNEKLFGKKIHTDAFYRLRTNILTPNVNKALKSMLITSAVPRDGKSAVTVNFAVNLANANRSVCVVDANLRYPSIHTYFNLNNNSGLCEVLENKAELSQVINHTDYPNLSVITSGKLVINPVNILDSNKMREVIAQLTKDFDLVLVDSPSSTSVTDPAVLSSMVDGVLIVVRHGWVRREALTRAVKYLTNVNANIIGIISNMTDQGARAKIFNVSSRV